jgi:hypothetical protein
MVAFTFFFSLCQVQFVKGDEEMLHFLERQLEKKVKVAEYLYLNNGQAIDKRVAQELGISMSSIQQYFKEIDQLYQAYRTNGTVYNSQSLLKITDGFVSQSIKMKLLKKLFIIQVSSLPFTNNH